MPISRRKYGNKKTEVDGFKFDSKAEAARWSVLKLLLKAGLIFELQRQVTYQIAVNGVKVCKYVADFVYVENGQQVVEDVKGFRTAEYRLKKKLMLAVHQIDIQEVK
jgi:hypothetical protein